MKNNDEYNRLCCKIVRSLAKHLNVNPMELAIILSKKQGLVKMKQSIGLMLSMIPEEDAMCIASTLPKIETLPKIQRKKLQ